MTVPAIWPALTFVTVMLVIGGFNVFTSVLLMTGGGPADQTQVLLTFMYEQAFKYLQFGYGSAIAVLLTAARVRPVGHSAAQFSVHRETS